VSEKQLWEEMREKAHVLWVYVRQANGGTGAWHGVEIDAETKRHLAEIEKALQRLVSIAYVKVSVLEDAKDRVQELLKQLRENVERLGWQTSWIYSKEEGLFRVVVRPKDC